MATMMMLISLGLDLGLARLASLQVLNHSIDITMKLMKQTNITTTASMTSSNKLCQTLFKSSISIRFWFWFWVRITRMLSLSLRVRDDSGRHMALAMTLAMTMTTMTRLRRWHRDSLRIWRVRRRVDVSMLQCLFRLIDSVWFSCCRTLMNSHSYRL